MMNAIHYTLYQWYEQQGRRDLPWRTTDNPYHVYISEIMLQQTQVKTVLERYYFQFLERFPTLQALADARKEDVLKAWEGLGYYTRARNLHAAAKIAAPALPNCYDALVALPGIGKNTAHAILALAFHQPVAVMEANLKRVLCRIYALEKPAEKALWEYANQFLDKNDPFTYNQAMMDIGAMVCTPKTPDCGGCPLVTVCKGKERPQRYPAPKAKTREVVRKRHIVVYMDEKKHVLLKAREGRFLHGLFGFSEYETLPAGLKGNSKSLGNIRQIYSHFTLQAKVYVVDGVPLHIDGEWYTLKDVKKLPLSRADQKVLALLDDIKMSC